MGVGGRVFDVIAEGQTVVDGLDVMARAGARYRALDIAFTIPVNDGKLNITFAGVPGKSQAFVSAIQVEPLSCGSGSPTATATPTRDGGSGGAVTAVGHHRPRPRQL